MTQFGLGREVRHPPLDSSEAEHRLPLRTADALGCAGLALGVPVDREPVAGSPGNAHGLGFHVACPFSSGPVPELVWSTRDRAVRFQGLIAPGAGGRGPLPGAAARRGEGPPCAAWGACSGFSSGPTPAEA